MLGDEFDVEVRPAEKLVRARDIKHVDLVVDRNAYEHLSSPRLRDVPIFDFCICRQVSANAIECHRRILVLALNCAGPLKIPAITKTRSTAADELYFSSLTV